MEILDIFDEHYNPIGVSTKKKVHELGLWHQVAGCIFIDSTQNRIYLQYKSAAHNEVAHKDKLDLSVGGHILSKETIPEGIVREIKEESSLTVFPEELIYLGYRKINVDATETYKIREFSHIFLLDKIFALSELHSTDDEVLYYVSFDINKLYAFITSTAPTIEGVTPKGIQSFSRENFIKGYIDDRIYETILVLSRNYIDHLNQELPIKLTK